MLLYESEREEVEHIFGDYVASANDSDNRVEELRQTPTTTRRRPSNRRRRARFANPFSHLPQCSKISHTPVEPIHSLLLHPRLRIPLCQHPRPLLLLTQPSAVGPTKVDVILATMSTSAKLQNPSRNFTRARKTPTQDLFADSGWEAAYLLAGMDKAHRCSWRRMPWSGSTAGPRAV